MIEWIALACGTILKGVEDVNEWKEGWHIAFPSMFAVYQRRERFPLSFGRSAAELCRDVSAGRCAPADFTIGM